MTSHLCKGNKGLVCSFEIGLSRRNDNIHPHRLINLIKPNATLQLYWKTTVKKFRVYRKAIVKPTRCDVLDQNFTTRSQLTRIFLSHSWIRDSVFLLQWRVSTTAFHHSSEITLPLCPLLLDRKRTVDLSEGFCWKQLLAAIVNNADEGVETEPKQ